MFANDNFGFYLRYGKGIVAKLVTAGMIHSMNGKVVTKEEMDRNINEISIIMAKIAMATGTGKLLAAMIRPKLQSGELSAVASTRTLAHLERMLESRSGTDKPRA